MIEDFKKWLKTEYKIETILEDNFSHYDIELAWDYQQAKLDAKDKELEALRNYARPCVKFGIFTTTAKSNGLIDEYGDPTKLLTGDK